jgi:membrane protein DedA with SNARE-associated domain
MLVASVVSDVTDAVTSAIGDYGLYAVFVLMAVDAVFPAASEVVMVYAGAVASGAFASQHIVLFGNELDSGLHAYLAVAIAGTLGYTVGSIGGWAIGRYGGRRYLESHGRWLHLDAERLERAERWFERWEDWAVFLGRLTPLVRSFVSIPAGVLEARFVRYVLLTLAGSAIWCFAFAGAGWAAGASWEDIHSVSSYADYLVVATVLAVVAWLLLRRRSKRRRLTEESAPR